MEEIIGPFLLKWLPEVITTGRYICVSCSSSATCYVIVTPGQGFRVHYTVGQYGALQCRLPR